MGRLTSEERRREIVKTAMLLFSEKGFRGTTTRELARRAGVSEALLFRHFPTKKRLYKAILEARMEEQVPLLLGGLPAGAPPRKVLYELAHRIVTQNERDPTFMRLLLFSALEGHELSNLFFQRRTLPLLAFLKNYLEGEGRAGRIRSIDPEMTGRAFLGLIFSLIQMRILFGIPQVVRKPARETLKTYVTIFLKGIER